MSVKEWIEKIIDHPISDHPIVSTTAPAITAAAIFNHFIPFFHAVDNIFNFLVAIAGGLATFLLVAIQFNKWKLSKKRLDDYDSERKRIKDFQQVAMSIANNSLTSGGRRAIDNEVKMLVDSISNNEED